MLYINTVLGEFLRVSGSSVTEMHTGYPERCLLSLAVVYLPERRILFVLKKGGYGDDSEKTSS